MKADSLIRRLTLVRQARRGNKTIIDKFFRTRNDYPDDEIRFEIMPTRPLEPEDQPHEEAMKRMLMEEDGNDERNIGPYPRVPNQHYGERDPWAKWDYPQQRRNFGEPVPYAYELFALEAPQPDKDGSVWQSLTMVGFFLALSYGIFRFGNWIGPKYEQAYTDAGYGPQRAKPVAYLEDVLPHPDHLLKHQYIDQMFGYS